MRILQQPYHFIFIVDKLLRIQNTFFKKKTCSVFKKLKVCFLYDVYWQLISGYRVNFNIQILHFK
jgi:hypothetical protein